MYERHEGKVMLLTDNVGAKYYQYAKIFDSQTITLSLIVELNPKMVDSIILYTSTIP